MLSYGGEDDGMRIDFPWSLSKERREQENIPLKKKEEAFDDKWNGLKFSRFLLCNVDVNPQNNHQDYGGWDKDCKSNIGSLHAVIHIKNLKGGGGHRKTLFIFVQYSTNKETT